MFSDFSFSAFHGSYLVCRNLKFIAGEEYVCCCKANSLQAGYCAGAYIISLYSVLKIWNISIEKYFMYVIIIIIYQD